jgi:hypothetical protein
MAKAIKEIFNRPISGSLETIPQIFSGVRGGLERFRKHFRVRRGLRSGGLLGGRFAAAIAGLVLGCITGSEELLLFFGNLYILFLLARGSGWRRQIGKIITLRTAAARLALPLR